MDERERLVYLLHSCLAHFDHKVKEACNIARQGFETMCKSSVSLSFGKDSTVMAHLLLQMDPDLPVMYINCGQWDEWPDTPRVKAEFLERFPCNFTELRGPSVIEGYREAGLFVQDEAITKEARKAQHNYGKSLAEILDAEAKQRGYHGAFIGVRKDESNNRSRLFAMHGPLYYAKTRSLWACHPLAFWTARDVWAYIVKYDLPYNELYDLDPQGREMARNGAMFGTRSARYGRLVFLRKMYPGWFNRFSAEFPEVRGYV